MQPKRTLGLWAISAPMPPPAKMPSKIQSKTANKRLVKNLRLALWSASAKASGAKGLLMLGCVCAE